MTLAAPCSGLDLARHVLAEITLDGRNAARVGDLRDVSRLDAENSVTALLEIGNQRAVVRSDVDDEIVRTGAQHFR